MSEIKLIDTFAFNGDPIVKLRLSYLYTFVDEFVIIESRYIHSGIKKSFLYKDKCAEWFKPYEDKIHWIVVDEFPEVTQEWISYYKKYTWIYNNYEHWFRENYQRNIAQSYIVTKYKGEKYFIYVGDVDEIPDADIFKPVVREALYAKMEKLMAPIYFEMDFFYYNFHWKNTNKWYRAYLCVDTLEINDFKNFSYWRVYDRPEYSFSNSGWHCSYFMSIEDIHRKILSFAHREYDSEPWYSIDHIRSVVHSGKDLFDRPYEQFIPNLEIKEEFKSFSQELDSLQK